MAADSVGDVLAETACGSERPARSTVTGPEVIRRVRVVGPPLPGFGDGHLVDPTDAVVTGPDVKTWLGSGSAHATWLKII